MAKHRIICFGDSITQAVGMAEADRWTAQLAFLLEAAFPETYDVFNRGIGGNTTALALDRINSEVIPLLPAVVLVQFGTNDGYVYPWSRSPRLSLSDFQANLREIIRQIQEGGGLPVLVVNHPLNLRKEIFHRQGSGKSIEKQIAPYNKAIAKVAHSERLGLIDLPSVMRKEKIQPETLWAEDRVHLSSTGNRIYGRLVFNELKKLFPKSISVKGSRS